MKLLQKSIFYLILLLLPNTYTQVLDVPAVDVGNANAYIDEVLENLRNDASMVAKLDPLKVPNVKEDKYEIKDLVIRGLSNLYRSGDFSVTYDGKIVIVRGEVAVKKMIFFTRYRAKAWFFWIKGKAEGNVDSLAVRMALAVKNGKTKLLEFKVTKLGGYKVNKITGMSFLLNWLLKLIVNYIAKSSRAKIIEVVEDTASTVIKDSLSNFKIPL